MSKLPKLLSRVGTGMATATAATPTTCRIVVITMIQTVAQYPIAQAVLIVMKILEPFMATICAALLMAQLS